MDIYLINITDNDIFLENLGCTISVDNTVDISEHSDISKIFDCDELKEKINNDNLRIFHDGTVLTKSNSIDYLTLQTKQDINNMDAPADYVSYVRKNNQQKNLKNEIEIQTNYILYGYLENDYILSSAKQNNLNNQSIDNIFSNNECFNYNSETGTITILKEGKYYLNYNLLIYNLNNENNSCYSQILYNNSLLNGSLLFCYLEKIKYNYQNINKKINDYSCNIIKDIMPIMCNTNDEITIQIKAEKSCKIDSQGTKFIINRIG